MSDLKNERGVQIHIISLNFLLLSWTVASIAKNTIYMFLSCSKK